MRNSAAAYSRLKHEASYHHRPIGLIKTIEREKPETLFRCNICITDVDIFSL
jgi:hypothetical protein